jgi:hypothetical protein
MISEIIRQRAYRILRALTSYRDLSEDDAVAPALLSGIAFGKGEVCLGVYENEPQKCEDSIIVTTRGLHVLQRSGIKHIPYAQIDFIDTPQEKDVLSLTLNLLDGASVVVPLKGGDGNFRDAFEFIRFLERVVRDVRKMEKPRPGE